MFTKRTIIIGLSLLLLLGNCFAEMPTELAFHSIPTSLIEHDFRVFLDQFDVLEGIGFYKCGDLNVKKLDALEQSNIRFEISVWKYVFSDVEEKYLDTLEFTHFAKRPTNQHEDESIELLYGSHSADVRITLFYDDDYKKLVYLDWYGKRLVGSDILYA